MANTQSRGTASKAGLTSHQTPLFRIFEGSEGGDKTHGGGWESITMLGEFCTSLCPDRYATRRAYETNRKAIEGFIISRRIKTLKSAALGRGKDFKEYFRAAGNSNATILGKANFFKRFLNYAVENGALDKHSFKLPRLSFEERDVLPRYVAFDYDEIKRICEAADNELREYLIVAFFTGARKGEILGLRASDLALNEDKIKIRRTRLENGDFNAPKTRSSLRDIDALPLVHKTLTERVERLSLAGDDLIFSMPWHVLKYRWGILLAGLGIKPVGVNSTRHSFISLMLERGESLEWVRSMAGHKDASVTLKKYSKLLKRPVSVRASFVKTEDFQNEK